MRAEGGSSHAGTLQVVCTDTLSAIGKTNMVPYAQTAGYTQQRPAK